MTRRVLVVAHWYPSHDRPGRGSFVADQVSALREAGVDIAVVAWEPVLLAGVESPAREERLRVVRRWAHVIANELPFTRPVHWGARGIPVVRLPAPYPAGTGATRNPLDLAPLQAEVLVPLGVALARRWRFDLVHAHGGLPDGLAAASLADQLDVPLITTEHDRLLPGRLQDPAIASAYRSLVGDGRRVLAVSSALAGILTRRLRLPPTTVEVVPNAVPVSLFRTAAAADRDPAELLWVGARKVNKGTATLLRAFARVRSERPGLRLTMIGQAPSALEDARLEALASELGVADAVAFEPPAERSVVAAAMARAALFVHPSPWETFGVVAVEALASGLPVAATPSGGVEEIVGHDGSLGEIADAADDASLAVAIGRALDRRATFDPDIMRSRVESRYAAPKVAQRLLGIYRDMVGEERHPAESGARPWDQTHGPSPAVPLVLSGRRRSALSRIPLLPEALLRRLTVLTVAAEAGSPAEGEPEEPVKPVVDRWLELDPDQAYRERVRAAGGPLSAAPRRKRIIRAIHHPLRWWTLRRLRRDRERLAGPVWIAGLREALGSANESDPGRRDPALVLPVDLDDVSRILPLVSKGVRLAPGTLGWLADLWDQNEAAAE